MLLGMHATHLRVLGENVRSFISYFKKSLYFIHEMWYLQNARTIVYIHNIEGAHVWNDNSFYRSVLL